MTFAKYELIAALRLRYDHYSAESVFDLARERAGLPDRHTYEAPELRAWRDGLAGVGDRVGSVLACIDDMLATAVAKPVTQPPVKQPPLTQQPGSAPVIEPTIVRTGVEASDDEHVLVRGGPPELGAPRGDLAPGD